MSKAYYNEIDGYAAAWLRNLIAAGLIPDGDVDERSIVDVQPGDLAGYTQVHLFAGIGGWALAARMAGWPDDRELWTGSCPCQPFSVIGKQQGTEDERHLWPEYIRLIDARWPAVVMGEQVAAAVGKHWLDGVLTDLEGIGYTGRAVVIPACSVDAPHKRDRLYFVADGYGLVGDGECARLEGHTGHGNHAGKGPVKNRPVAPAGVRGFWSDHEWIKGHDGKMRRVQPGLCGMVDGFSASLGRLRAIEATAIEEVTEYAHARETDPSNVLRMVWKEVREEKSRQKQSARMCFQFSSPEVLFGFLRGLESALKTQVAPSVSKTSHEIQLRIMRSLWEPKGDRGTPRERKPPGQQAIKSPNPLLVLSLVLARHAEAYREEAREAYASLNRVDMLRAYGNAIVPELAAQVIGAYMDVT